MLNLDFDGERQGNAACKQTLKCGQTVASQETLFSRLEIFLQDLPIVSVSESLVPETGFQEVYANLCNMFVNQPTSINDWLVGVQSALSSNERVPHHVTFLVAAVLVVSHDQDIIQSALRLFPLIAKSVEEQVQNNL